MSEEAIVKQVSEEIETGLDLGYETEHIAKNIVALIKSEREHLDFNPSTNQYDWEQEQ